MSILIKNIKKLVQVEDKPKKWKAGKEMAEVDSIDNAWLLIEDGLIKDFGQMSDLQTSNSELRTPNFRSLMRLVKWFSLPSAIPIPTWFILPAVRLNMLTRSKDYRMKRLPKEEEES